MEETIADEGVVLPEIIILKSRIVTAIVLFGPNRIRLREEAGRMIKNHKNVRLMKRRAHVSIMKWPQPWRQ